MKPGPITWITADPDQVRANLRRLIEEQQEALAPLSRFIGRSDGYLHRFLEGGSPVKLLARDRLMLAKYFRVDERLLGAAEDEARPPWSPPKRTANRKPWHPWWLTGHKGEPPQTKK